MLKKILPFLLILTAVSTCSYPELDDIDPPFVFLIYPFNGAVISEDFQVRIQAYDDDKIDEVWIYIDDNLVAKTSERTDINYLINVPIDAYKDGREHNIQAGASDKSGNNSISAPVRVIFADGEDVINPTVSIISPQNGQNLEGIVKITAIAEDDRSIEKVAFFVDGDSVNSDFTYPYSYDWNTLPYADSATHTIYAKTFDTGGNSAISGIVTVTVLPSTDQTAPTGFIAYPIAGQVVFDTVNVVVDANDNRGISRVEFYIDGLKQFEDFTVPYLFEWNTLPYADDREHSIYAKIYDLSQNYSITERIVVTVTTNVP